jgi:hypothetical protein
MVQKTYFKTKDYCKVKFSFAAENAETIEILGLNSDWENSIVMSKKKTEALALKYLYLKIHNTNSNTA